MGVRREEPKEQLRVRKIKGQKAALVIVYHIISLRDVEITILWRKNKGMGVMEKC